MLDIYIYLFIYLFIYIYSTCRALQFCRSASSSGASKGGRTGNASPHRWSVCDQAKGIMSDITQGISGIFPGITSNPSHQRWLSKEAKTSPDKKKGMGNVKLNVFFTSGLLNWAPTEVAKVHKNRGTPPMNQPGFVDIYFFGGYSDDGTFSECQLSHELSLGQLKLKNEDNKINMNKCDEQRHKMAQEIKAEI